MVFVAFGTEVGTGVACAASVSPVAGLGLTIATGQARLLGARLIFRNRRGRGAETELQLPTA